MVPPPSSPPDVGVTSERIYRSTAKLADCVAQQGGGISIEQPSGLAQAELATKQAELFSAQMRVRDGMALSGCVITWSRMPGAEQHCERGVLRVRMCPGGGARAFGLRRQDAACCADAAARRPAIEHAGICDYPTMAQGLAGQLKSAQDELRVRQEERSRETEHQVPDVDTRCCDQHSCSPETCTTQGARLALCATL